MTKAKNRDHSERGRLARAALSLASGAAAAFVLAVHRDQGIGSRLLRALLDYTDGHGYVRVVLNPSQRSGPFYRRNGFSAEHGLLVRRRPG